MRPHEINTFVRDEKGLGRDRGRSQTEQGKINSDLLIMYLFVVGNIVIYFKNNNN